LVVKRRSVDNKFQDSLKKTNISEVISFIGVGLFYLQQRVQYQKKEREVVVWKRKALLSVWIPEELLRMLY
jgi:hypothetical protein